MSGTSLDGIDAVLVAFRDNALPHMAGAFFCAYPDEVRRRILKLCDKQPHDLSELCKLDVLIGELFASAIAELLSQHGYTAEDVVAIGSHGQTVLHHSGDSTGKYSLQLGDPSTIAYQTGITTVADFRRMDIAANGQGAPLVPAFHDAVFRHPCENRVVVNIGGMANITVLLPNRITTGFDTGPGNVLMDTWSHIHTSQPFDQNGTWAASGLLNQLLLEHWLAHPYFLLSPPKSTGREMFDLPWLRETLAETGTKSAPVDIQRTLTELTARTISDQIQSLPADIDTILVCGGGCHNTLLMQRLPALNPASQVCSTASSGIDPDWLEAIAFAWLAKQRIDFQAGNIPSVTGADKPCLLGGVYAPPPR